MKNLLNILRNYKGIDLLLRLYNSRLNFPRELYRRFFKFLTTISSHWDVSESSQDNNFLALGLSRYSGLDLLNEVLQKEFQTSYDENNGMFSEHLILLAAIAKKFGDSINSVLEIGTFDGRTALILSRLFQSAKITTIELPDTSPEFLSTYHRGDIESFTQQRNQKLNKYENIIFKEMNSLQLSRFDQKFDLIWIDGAHGYPVVAMDVINSFRLCSSSGHVLIDDIWKSVGISDQFYRSIGGYHSLLSLVEAKLIKKVHLIPKRLSGRRNLKWEKKFVGYFNKT